VKDLESIDFEITESDETGAIISCSQQSALRLIHRLGASYKIARILKEPTVGEAVRLLELPYVDKFNWTISGYNTNVPDIEEAKEEIRDFLKEKNLGRSKFIDPLTNQMEDADSDPRSEEGRFQFREVKASDLLSRVFGVHSDQRKRSKGQRESASMLEGIDFVVHGGIGDSGPFFADTIGMSDIAGFETRDFARPYQDPTLTLSPRIARAIVNMAAINTGGVMLDPFCGLGTFLQEAVVLGYSAIGIDKNADLVSRAKTNLRWTLEEFLTGGVRGSTRVQIIRQDARRIHELALPRVDFIASEPILLPSFKKNPSSREANYLINESEQIYEAALENLGPLLSSPNSRIALTTPTIIDSGGRAHSVSIADPARKAGLSQFWPKSLRNRKTYPLRIESAKKKIVLRNLNLFALG